jgi:hypothetical protein
MKKHAIVDLIMSIIVGPAAEVRDLSDDPTALAEAQATLERHEAKNSGARMIAAARRHTPRARPGLTRRLRPATAARSSRKASERP